MGSVAAHGADSSAANRRPPGVSPKTSPPPVPALLSSSPLVGRAGEGVSGGLRLCGPPPAAVGGPPPAADPDEAPPGFGGPPPADFGGPPPADGTHSS